VGLIRRFSSLPGLWSTLALGSLTALTIVLNFVTQAYVLARLGAGNDTDALYLGLAVTSFFYDVVCASVSVVLMPLLVTRPDQAGSNTWSVFQAMGMLFAGLATVLALAAPYWLPVLSPGFTAAGKSRAVSITQVLLFGMVLSVLWEVLFCYHYSRGRFLWTQSCVALTTFLSLICTIYLLPRLGILAAAWSVVVRAAVAVLLMLPGLGSYSLLRWRAPLFREIWRGARPVMLSSAYLKSDILVERVLATFAPAGQLSLLGLSRQVIHASNRVLRESIVQPMVPELARSANARDWLAFNRAIRNRLLLIIVLCALATMAIVFIGRSGLALAFHGQRLTAEDITLMWWLIILLVGAFVAEPIGKILSNAFYSIGRSDKPSQIGVVSYSIGIGLKVIGFLVAGIKGIALAVSVYYLLHACLLYWSLRRLQQRTADEFAVQ